jgi:hypothetical protein
MSGFWRKIQEKWRHGLIWQVILDKLSHLGIGINLYYWTDESQITPPGQSSADDFAEFECRYLEPADFRQIDLETQDWLPYDTMVERQQSGRSCYGMLHHGQVASFTWFALDACEVRTESFPLKEHEAYLFDMWTMKSYRGRGLAPYLRFNTVQLLRGLGKTHIFSITDVTNSSSRKFKQKLNVKFSRKCLSVTLFNRRLGHWTLQDNTSVAVPERSQVSTSHHVIK